MELRWRAKLEQTSGGVPLDHGVMCLDVEVPTSGRGHLLEPWYVGPIILNIRGHREPAADRGWMTGNSHLTVAVLL
jgi:hypothetical protein